MPTVKMSVETFRTKKQQQLIKMLKDKSVRKKANTILAEALNKFVPKNTGALKDSVKVTDKTISWGKGLKYARYQYGGKVYGPNYPGIEENGGPGWRSSKGKGSKYPTERELGISGTALLHPVWQVVKGSKGSKGSYVKPGTGVVKSYKFGYTTPGTKHHWDKLFTYKPKQEANLEITRMLRRECKARGLNV